MKKIRFLILILILLVGTTILAGCGEIEAQVTEIAIIGETKAIAIGEFSYDDFSIQLTYDDGTTKNIAFTEDMLPATERVKLLQEGNHTLTVSAFGKTCELAIEIKRRTIDNAVFESMSNSDNYVEAKYDAKHDWYVLQAEYTGNPYKVTVGGLLPDGYTVSFPEDNSFLNAGEYEISAIVSCNQYASKTIKALVIIERADYDFSNFRMENKEYVYDGTMKYLTYEGTLPQGLTGKYYIGESASGLDMIEGYGAEKAGVYYVYLDITGETANYNEVKNPYAVLNIRKREISVENLEWTENEFTYDGEYHTIEIKSEQIPLGLNPVKYSNNSRANIGEYVAIAEFSVVDSANYTVKQYVQKDFYIRKAKYDLSGIVFEPQIYTYDGTAKSLEYSLKEGYTLPDTLEIQFEENSFVDAGVYEVTLKFINSDDNFENPEDLVQNLIILPQEHSLKEYTFERKTFNYDGFGHELSTIIDLPEFYEAEYTYAKSISKDVLGLSQDGQKTYPVINEDGSIVQVKEPDTYTVTARVSVVDENYAIDGADVIYTTVTINPPAINLLPYEIGFLPPEKNYQYNGQEQGINLVLPENDHVYYDVWFYEFVDDGTDEGDWNLIESKNTLDEGDLYGAIVPNKYKVHIFLYYLEYLESMKESKSTKDMEVEFVIDKAVYTAEDFKFKDKKVEFNGEIQTIEIDPENMQFGVTAEYSTTQKTGTQLAGVSMPGQYVITATLSFNSEYIVCPTSIEANLFVDRATINIDSVKVENIYDFNANYHVYPYTEIGEEIFPITSDRKDIMSLPGGNSTSYGKFTFGTRYVEYNFLMKKGDETVCYDYKLDDSNLETLFGTYTLYLVLNNFNADVFVVKYNDLSQDNAYHEVPIYSFEIKELDVDLPDYSSTFKDYTKNYDFESVQLSLGGTIPEHANVAYTYTKAGDATIYSGNTFIDFGVYTLTAKLTADPGYKLNGTTEYTITVTINKITLDYNAIYLALRFTIKGMESWYSVTPPSSQMYFQFSNMATEYYAPSNNPYFYCGTGVHPTSNAIALYVKDGGKYTPLDLGYYYVDLSINTNGTQTDIYKKNGSNGTVTYSDKLDDVYFIKDDQPATISFKIASKNYNNIVINNLPDNPKTFNIIASNDTVIPEYKMNIDSYYGYPSTVLQVPFAVSLHEITYPEIRSEYSDQMTMSLENVKWDHDEGNYKWYCAKATFTCKEGYIFWTGQKTYTIDRIDWRFHR